MKYFQIKRPIHLIFILLIFIANQLFLPSPLIAFEGPENTRTEQIEKELNPQPNQILPDLSNQTKYSLTFYDTAYILPQCNNLSGDF